MLVREFKKEDLQQINKWHELRKTQPTPIECLPKSGFIIDGVAVGFLYQTDSRVSWAEGFVSNPEAKKKDVVAAFHLLFDAVEKRSKELGNVLMFMFSQGKGFSRRYKKHEAISYGKHYLYAKVLMEKVKGGNLNG